MYAVVFVVILLIKSTTKKVWTFILFCQEIRFYLRIKENSIQKYRPQKIKSEFIVDGIDQGWLVLPNTSDFGS